MDDFFLPPETKTEARLIQTGGNVDWERFREEVLENIRRGNKFCYRKYDCKIQSFHPPAEVNPKKLNLVEGVYSLHPELIDYYDLKLFLWVDEEEQSRRILHETEPSCISAIWKNGFPWKTAILPSSI